MHTYTHIYTHTEREREREKERERQRVDKKRIKRVKKVGKTAYGS